MTSPTTENTVFSTQVAEPAKVGVAPARCEEGARLMHEWVLEYNAEKSTQPAVWQKLMFKPRTYDDHALGCVQCFDYELARRGLKREQVLVTEEKK